MKKLLFAGAACAAVIGMPAMAATDGSLSHHHSTGTVTVGTFIPRLVEISGLSDLKVKVTAANLTASLNTQTQREDATEHFCIYSNVGAQGGYNLKIDGDASNNADGSSPFVLTGAGGDLDYNVWVSDDTSNEFLNYVYPGDVEKNYTTAADGNGRRTTLDCKEGSDASIKVGVNDANLVAAQSGYYKGKLTLTVSPI